MAENTSFDFSFAPHKEYTPYSGDASDMIPFDGFVAVKLGNMKPYLTKEKKFPALKVASVILDEDGKGLRLVDDVMCGGKDKNGDDLGRQFCDLLVSAGTPVDAIRQNAANGASAPIEHIIAKIAGKEAYCEIQADVYEGKDTSKVINWITKERYDQAKVIGAHRRSRRKVVQQNAAGAQNVNLGGGIQTNAAGPGTNGTVAPAAAAAGKSDTLPML